MEILALGAVNFLTAVGLYFLFSLRSSRSVRQSRKAPLTPELKENIELTVKYINSSLELIDQKKKACYQMLRRAEELSSGVEKKVPGSPSSPTPKNDPVKKSRNKTKKTPRQTAKTSETLFLKKENARPSYNVERALERLGQDEVEITPSAPDAQNAYLSGASLYHREQEQKNPQRPTAGFISQAERPKTLSRHIWTWARSWLQDLSKAFPSASQPPFILSQAKQKALLPPESEGSFLRKSDLPGSNQTEENSTALSSQLGHIPPLRNLGIELPNTFPERAQLLRTLLEQNYTKEEISSATGIALAELNLIVSLLPVPQSPRRKRLESQDRAL